MVSDLHIKHGSPFSFFKRVTHNYTVRYVLRRLGETTVSFLGLSVLIFALARVIPGNPAELALGPYATQAQINQLSHQWGLDKPIYIQYYNFITGVFQGHFGPSVVTFHDVFQDITTYLPATYELITVSMIIAVVVGIPFGVFAATHKDRLGDHASRIFSLAGYAFPLFWTAIMLDLILAFDLKIFPIEGRLSDIIPPTHITGSYILDSLLTGNWATLASSLDHIALPALVLSFPAIANISRLVRSQLLEESDKDYIQLSKVNGIPYSVITYKYMLKNSLAPAITMVALMFSYAFGSVVLIEEIFSWPGIGSYLVTSIYYKDLNAIAGVVLVVGLIIAIANLAADLINSYIDPRSRQRRSK